MTFSQELDGRQSNPVRVEVTSQRTETELSEFMQLLHQVYAKMEATDRFFVDREARPVQKIDKR